MTRSLLSLALLALVAGLLAVACTWNAGAGEPRLRLNQLLHSSEGHGYPEPGDVKKLDAEPPSHFTFERVHGGLQ